MKNLFHTAKNALDCAFLASEASLQ